MTTRTTPLGSYRQTLERVRGGTVPAELALEILDAAEIELAKAHGEYTLAQAMAMSGRSRTWFERRLERWQRLGLARKPGRDWLLARAAIPEPDPVAGVGFDPWLSDDEILRRLREHDEAA